MSSAKSGSYHSLVGSPMRRTGLRFAKPTKRDHMIEDDRSERRRPAEAQVNVESTHIAESREAKYTLVQRVLREAGIGIALLLMILAFAALAPHFTDESNITNILTQVTINLIMATGMTFVILIGGIDLSVGSVLAFAAMVAGVVLKSEALPGPAAILLAVLTSIAVGMACGFLNGFIASFWGVPSFIVTLGMLNVARGAALEVTNARTLFEFPNEFNAFGTATLLGIPAIFLVALMLVLLGWAVLTRTVFGRLIYAIGNNEEAVRLSGHNTFFYKVSAFVISGLTVGIGAIIYMSRLTIASPILGSGFELNAIAAVIIGGTSLNGGRGSLIGTLPCSTGNVEPNRKPS